MTPQTNQPTDGADNDFTLTLFEVCEMLNKSTRTITRYIQRNILHPRHSRSRKGTLEYRFSYAEVERVREANRANQSYLYGRPVYRTTYNASFADYNALAQPPAAPFLAPGMSYPAMPNYAYQDPPVQYPQSMPQGAPQGRINSTQDFNAPRQDLPPLKKQDAPQKNIQKEDLPPAEKKEMPGRASEEIISLLKETTEMLRGQLKIKDDQIKNLDDKIGQMIERNRETNILLKGLQDKIMLLEKPKAKREKDKLGGGAKKIAEAKTKSPLADMSPIEIVADAPRDSIAPSDSARQPAEYNLPLPPLPAAAADVAEDESDLPEKKGLFGKIFG